MKVEEAISGLKKLLTGALLNVSVECAKNYEEAIQQGISALEKQVAKKPQTNADRIRAMSDEELARFFYEYEFACEYHCPAQSDECCDDCVRSIEEWLKKEVADE